MKYLTLMAVCYLTNISTANDPMITLHKSDIGLIYATGWNDGFTKGLDRPNTFNKVLKARTIDSLNYMKTTIK